MNKILSIVLAASVCIANAVYAQPSLTTHLVDNQTLALTVTFDLKPHEYIYQDYIDFSVDNPSITLSEWKSSQPAITHYDTTFKEDKKIFKNKVTITLQAKHAQQWSEQRDPINLHIAYRSTPNKTMTENILALNPLAPVTPLAYAVDVSDAEITQENPQESLHQAEPISAPATEKKASFSARISALAEHTHSTWLRFLLVIVLGMLLSLTPCIYPMIPITVGILQAHGSKSFLSNLLISSIYVAGIATTFALLGLLAAFTGQVFGTLMSNPFVILVIVALLVYVAFSMFGFYELYIPKSLQQNKSSIKSGSLLSIFLFGALSGTVASPCLSPGLILLLSIVTTLGSKFLGFILLFGFGLGLGLPLLIIGTFSSSLAMLPKAGMWMVEIKKLSGLLLLGMCFYFLRIIIPLSILWWLSALYAIASGVWLLYEASKTTSFIWRFFKNILGIAFLAASCVIIVYGYKEISEKPSCDEKNLWNYDYQQAFALAQQQGKRIFIDIGAPFCSLCKAIDATTLKDQTVICALQEYITLKVDGSDTNDQAIVNLLGKYSIIGFPTFLIIDPEKDQLIKRWEAEVYDMSPAEFAAALREMANA